MRSWQQRTSALWIVGIVGGASVAFFGDPAIAMPPTPPAEVRLPGAEALADLQARGGAISVPAEVRAHRDVPPLEVTIRALPTDVGAPRAPESDTYEVEGMARGGSQRIEIRIADRAEDGAYRLEVALEATIDGRPGILDKDVLYQVVEDDRTRLLTPREYRRLQVADRRAASRDEGARRNSGPPDIESLAERTATVPPERSTDIVLHPRPSVQRGVAKPPRTLSPHIVRPAPRPVPPGVVPIPTTRISGQIVFEDFYYQVLGEPNVLSPLANATVSVFQRYGASFLLATVETDANGAWEARVTPAVQTSADPTYYYVVELANAALDVRDAAANEYVWVSAERSAPTAGIINYGQEVLPTNAEAAQVFATVNRGWEHITLEGGQDPGHIDIQYPDSCLVDVDPDPYVTDLQPSSCWDPNVEIVRIEAPDNSAPDVILHEYGHALFFYAHGTNTAGGSHSFEDFEQTPGIAYDEGWATAFALSVCRDGNFNFDDGPYEAVEEWPNCETNYDFGEYIEGFSHDGNTNANDDLSDDNRNGALHEGRVAATFVDLFDSDDDDNGGTEDRGRNNYEDGNAGNEISLATIYRDNMWGFAHQDFPSFYTSLQSNLSGAVRDLATDINVYNYIAIPAPLICVASKVALHLAPDYADALDGLRAFRDHIMKPLHVGRGWIQSYYSNSPEMAAILIGSPQAREAAQVIIQHFAAFGRMAAEPGAIERMASSREPVLPRSVMRAIAEVADTFDEKGSAELRMRAGEARRFLATFRDMSVGEAVRRVAAMKPADEARTVVLIDPLDFAPGSQEVDWAVIREHLPAEEQPLQQP